MKEENIKLVRDDANLNNDFATRCLYWGFTVFGIVAAVVGISTLYTLLK